jgi:hypothetical protein
MSTVKMVFNQFKLLPLFIHVIIIKLSFDIDCWHCEIDFFTQHFYICQHFLVKNKQQEWKMRRTQTWLPGSGGGETLT